MLMIRLRRVGKRHNPIYRVVVSDSRKRPTSRYLEQVGFYDPHITPPEIRLDMERVDDWRGKGAGVSETVKSLIRRVQRQQ